MFWPSLFNPLISIPPAGYTANSDPVTNLNQFVLDWPIGFSQILATIAIVEGASNPTVSLRFKCYICTIFTCLNFIIRNSGLAKEKEMLVNGVLIQPNSMPD